uniref:Outer membrane efflux protein n=1 Tax=mine drainage metagenome TaxID=410659 RepID=E6QLK8_9ZZZZ
MSSAIPFTHPNANAVITQPLLRGAGRSTNTRFIAIAKTNRKISLAVLEQQMISTVSGVETLYYDLVSLQDSVGVQERALKAATTLLSDDREQLRVGNMAPIEVVRAQALVTASQLAVTQANSLRQQQENILRSVLDPLSLTNTTATLKGIVATDQLSPPPDDPPTPITDLIDYAWVNRPDVRQALLQIKNGELAVAASAKERLPEVDVYGAFQTRGTPNAGLVPLGGDPVYAAAALDANSVSGARSAQNYEIGVQFNLPLQNRVARADNLADRAELKEQQLRVTQIKAQVAAQVRNAVIGLVAARESASAAATSQRFQEALLAATTESFQAGMSTNFAVVEQQTYLAQAETTAVAARAAWMKAKVQLARALGDTLQQQGIAVVSPKAKSNSEQSIH